MPEQEEWRPIPDFGDYQVSDLGRVASHKGKAPQILRPYLTDGYPTVTLYGDGGRRLARVHCIVAEAFIGPRPDGLEIRHLDGDELNPAASNLRYGTHAENMQDRLAHGRHPQVNKTHCPRDHEYTPENTFIQQGGRVCRTCKRIRQAEYKTRRALRAANVPASAAA